MWIRTLIEIVYLPSRDSNLEHLRPTLLIYRGVYQTFVFIIFVYKSKSSRHITIANIMKQ